MGNGNVCSLLPTSAGATELKKKNGMKLKRTLTSDNTGNKFEYIQGLNRISQEIQSILMLTLIAIVAGANNFACQFILDSYQICIFFPQLISRFMALT